MSAQKAIEPHAVADSSRFHHAMIFLTAGLAALFLWALVVGRYDIGPEDLFAIFRNWLQGGPLTGDLGTQALVFFQVRLPPVPHGPAGRGRTLGFRGRLPGPF